jgi:hypothetical protein
LTQPWFLSSEALGGACTVVIRTEHIEGAPLTLAKGVGVKLKVPPLHSARVALVSRETKEASFKVVDFMGQNPLELTVCLTQFGPVLQNDLRQEGGGLGRRVHAMANGNSFWISGGAWPVPGTKRLDPADSLLAGPDPLDGLSSLFPPASGEEVPDAAPDPGAFHGFDPVLPPLF